MTKFYCKFYDRNKISIPNPHDSTSRYLSQIAIGIGKNTLTRNMYLQRLGNSQKLHYKYVYVKVVPKQ